MYLHSNDIVEYVESELMDWISNPVLINTPMLLSDYKSEFEINPLPDSKVWFKIHFRDNDMFVIQWSISLTKNQDYLPEDTNYEILLEEIKNVILSNIHFEDSELEEFSTQEINGNITYSQILTEVNTNKLGEHIDDMSKTELSTEFGSTEIYLNSDEPEDSLDEFLRYNDISDVYDIIFDSKLREDLNINIK